VRFGAQDYLLKGDLNSKMLFKVIFYAIERKKAEKELIKSEVKLKTVADFTYDWEYWVAPDGSIIYISPSCERISGYTAHEFMNDTGLLEKITHPDDKKIILKHHHDSQMEEKSDEFEFRIIRKDGKVLWINHNCQPVYSEDGKFSGRRASNEDINERKMFEIQLTEREEQLRLFIENAPAAIAMFDNQMNYISVSKRWTHDYNLKEEIIGRSHYDVFPEITDKWMKVHKRALAGSIESADEDKFIHEDGTVQWLKWEVIPWYSPSGNIGGIIISSEDITKLKLANEALKENEQFLEL
jgi:PAS domain S-box-containing protein